MTDDTCAIRAVLWEPAEDGKVQCKLCAHRCLIPQQQSGYCSVRCNVNGSLYSLAYGKICAANADPVEKKPLFHFLPGSKSFSIAAQGCNFRCEFCQNWQISQAPLESGEVKGQPVSVQEIVHCALENRCQSIAYTYTEPTVFMELCSECAHLAQSKGLLNVMVSNGYQTIEAIDFAKDWLHGINIDLKAFNSKFYNRFCKARLEPVLEVIEYIARHTDIWMEITTLIVPGQNDSKEELSKLADFIVNKAGPDVPWHVSRFYAQYKCSSIETTPVSTLEMACEIGKNAGLNYVYPGNIPGSNGESTFCAQCSKLLIKRNGYVVQENYLDQGVCPDCGLVIPGRFT